MNKKLTAKIQQLNPLAGQATTEYSRCLIIEPESADIELKKGRIFAVVDISAVGGFDPNIISKIINDILHDSYYQYDNISPIQSLEKAIVDVRDKITQLPGRPTVTIQEHSFGEIKFNMLAGVLWGNVLYVVQYGTGECFLMREGQVRAINRMSEGSFSAASGIVKDEDVVILCTKEFGAQYPPTKLMSSAISEQELKMNQACLLLKFMVDTSFSKSEIVDFGLEEIKPKTKSSLFFDSVSDRIGKISGGAGKTLGGISSRLKLRRTEKIKGIASSSNLPLKAKTFFKTNSYIFVAFAAFLLVGSVLFSLRNRQEQMAENQANTENDQGTGIKIVEELSGESLGEQDNREDGTVFYDLKIADSSLTATDIQVFSEYVVVSDRNSGKLLLSSAETPKFETIGENFNAIGSLQNYNEDFSFLTQDAYIFYDLEGKKILNSYNQTGMERTATYLDYIYAIQGDKIVKYSQEGQELKSTDWAQNEDFRDARSLAVAYSIYAITKEGNIVSYTTGQKNDFAIDGLETAFNNPVKIVTNINFNNIYIADKGNQRIVVLTTKGKFVKEIKSDKPGINWDNLESFAISPDEKTLFLLNGSLVYKIDL